MLFCGFAKMFIQKDRKCSPNIVVYFLLLGRKLPCLCLAENETIVGNKAIVKYLNLKVFAIVAD